MRILIAVTSHLSYRLVQGQIGYLTSKNHQVYFCSTYSKFVQEKVEEEGGIFVPIDLNREINVSKDLLSVFKAYTILFRINPDIINISTPKASLIFTLASILNRKTKVIFVLRGLRFDTLKGLKRIVVKFTEAFVCSIADKIIVISPSLLAHGIEENIIKSRKAIVLGKGSSNGINISKFTLNSKIQKDADLLKMTLEIPDDSIVFGYIGRITRDKGVIELVDAFILINEKYPKTLLVISGPIEHGDYVGSACLHLIRNHANIRYIDGFNHNVATLMSIFHIFILYSRREGFGNVVIEAASMCKPALVSDIPGARDTIENMVTGLLVKPNSVHDLSQMMEYYILNPKEIQTHGINGRKRVENYFLNSHIWIQQLLFYESLFHQTV
jgi:glycosyltransferase involved in cell wall biosynthesis